MDLIDILMADAIISKKLPPAILNLKGSVATTSELPLSGNAKGDVWVVTADNSEWVWMSDSSSGTLSDYDDFGVVVDLSPYRTAADQDIIDSGKQAKITASGMLKGDGTGGVTSATAGTDYGTYSKPTNGIPASDLESAVLTPYRTSADQDVIDGNKQAKVTASGILKGDGTGGISAAVEGTDYGVVPAVTSVDDGKFARVVNGAWAAVTIPEAAGGDF